MMNNTFNDVFLGGMTESQLSDEMLVAMAEAGTPPVLMWLWIKTGLIPAETNKHLMSREDRKNLRKATREWDEKQPDLGPYIEAARYRLQCAQDVHGTTQ